MIIKLCCDETFYKSTQQSNEKELLQKKKIVLLTNDCVLASPTLFLCIWTISAPCAFLSSYIAVRVPMLQRALSGGLQTIRFGEAMQK